MRYLRDAESMPYPGIRDLVHRRAYCPDRSIVRPQLVRISLPPNYPPFPTAVSIIRHRPEDYACLLGSRGKADGAVFALLQFIGAIHDVHNRSRRDVTVSE